jgi:hypothetical protein
MSTNIFQRISRLLPDAVIYVGRVLAHHDDDTSTVELPIGLPVTTVGGGLARGSILRPRGRTVPVGGWAFVRRGVIETHAPDAFAVPVGVGTPPVGTPDPDLVLLVNADDSLAVDQSPYLRMTTFANGAVSSTAQSKYGTRSLLTSAANNSTLVIDSAGAAAQLGTGDCTFEFWAYRLGASAGNGHLMDSWAGNFLIRYVSGELQFYTAGDSLVMNPTFSLPTDQWVHIAVVRVGTTWTLWRDGVLHTTATGMAGAASSGSVNAMYLGGGSGPNDAFNGHVNGARIIKRALYTSTFTPPAGPLSPYV